MEKPRILSCGVYLSASGQVQTHPEKKGEKKGYLMDIWRKKVALHRLGKNVNPSEVPPPEVPSPAKNPEIKPGIPEKPVLPSPPAEPEILPETEPDDPSPGEIPLPKAKHRSGK